MKCEAFWPSKVKSILQKLFYDKKSNILRNFDSSQIIYLDVWYNFENKILKVFGISDFHFSLKSLDRYRNLKWVKNSRMGTSVDFWFSDMTQYV